MQNFSEGNIFKLGLNEEGVRNWVENWPYIGNGERQGQGYY